MIERQWSGPATLTPWPFPDDPDGPGKNTLESWDVFDDAGKYLSSITTWPEVGGCIALVCDLQPLLVTAVYPFDGRVIVRRT